MGLEGFRRHAALQMFNRVRLDGFAFDAELLFLAHRLGFKLRRSTSTPRDVTAASPDEDGGGSAGQPADPAIHKQPGATAPHADELSVTGVTRSSQPATAMRRRPGERKPTVRVRDPRPAGGTTALEDGA